MNLRVALIIGCSAICALIATGVVLQQREISELRRQHRELLNQANTAPRISPSGVDELPKTPSPSIELLRLRSEVNRLLIRRRELQGVGAENERLRTQVAINQTNRTASSRLNGYLRKSTARNLGRGTPEAALETMLWAIQNRDLNTFKESFVPAAMADLEKHIQEANQTGEDFFAGSEAVPPMRIINRQQFPDGSVELTIGSIPEANMPENKIRFQLVNGEWKMEKP